MPRHRLILGYATGLHALVMSLLSMDTNLADHPGSYADFVIQVGEKRLHQDEIFLLYTSWRMVVWDDPEKTEWH